MVKKVCIQISVPFPLKECLSGIWGGKHKHSLISEPSDDLNALPELDAVVIDHDLDLRPSEFNETDSLCDFWVDELEATVMGQ